MTRSMTGFGQGRGQTPWGEATVEARSVNHRYLKVSVHLPRDLDSLWLEQMITTHTKRHVARGAVEVRVAMVDGGTSAGVALDRELLKGFLRALREAAEECGIKGEVELAMLPSLPGLFRTANAEPTGEEAWAALEPIVDEAFSGLVAMRAEEGGIMAEIVRGLLHRIDAGRERIAAVAPERVLQEEARLRTLLARVTEGPLNERVETEVVIYADRVDIQEELDRLAAHTSRCLETLDGDGPIGKRVGFFFQEMHREANTIGAKANDARIAQEVVEIKGALEQLREQAENLE